MNEYDFLGVFAAFFVVIGIILLICAVIDIIAMWTIFKKAGKPGWHSIIPFLNTYDLYEISWSGKMGYVAIALSFISSFLSRTVQNDEASGTVAALCGLVGLVLFIISIISYVYLSKSFGYGGAFAVGLILLNPIFMMILAFGGSQYIGPKGEPIGGMYANGGYAAYAQQAYSNAGYETYGSQQTYAPNQNFQAQGYAQPAQDYQAQGYAQPQQGFQAQGYDAQPQQQVNPFENNNNNYGNYQ